MRQDAATAALVFYAFGMVAILSAAVLSGFVAPEVVADRPLLYNTGQLNQGFAKVRVPATGASLIVVVTLLQGIWIVLVAAHLLREGSNGRHV